MITFSKRAAHSNGRSFPLYFFVIFVVFCFCFEGMILILNVLVPGHCCLFGVRIKTCL